MQSFSIRIVFFLLPVLVSCRKFIQVDPPASIVPRSAIFASDAAALSAASQVYVNMRLSSQHFSYTGMSLFGGLLADEITTSFSIDTYDAFLKNALNSNDATVNAGFWSAAYRNIYVINAVLEGLDQSTQVSDALKKQLTGEMQFVRAWYYFYLVNLFGDVPLVTGTSYSDNAGQPRKPIDEVYAQVLSDLRSAETLLPEAYPSAGKARPNGYAAKALLARVLLYMAEWPAAAAKAGEVIRPGLYQLVSNPDEVFLTGSPETIWETAPDQDRGNNILALSFIPYSADSRPFICLTPSLAAAFEPGDRRKAHWTGTNTVPGPPDEEFLYPYKYKNKDLSGTPTEYNTVLRYDEVLLIRSEALARSGQLPEAAADLNLIRQRAGLPAIYPASTAAAIDAVLQERRVELFTEWGHRWFDLRRTGTINATLSDLKGPDWQSTDALLPIPYPELLYNPALIQNPGY